MVFFHKKKKIRIAIAMALLVLLVFGVYYSVFFHRETAGASVWRVLRADALAFALNPSAEMAERIGDYYFNVGKEGAYDLDKAEKFYTRAVMLDPERTLVLYQLGRIDFLRGEFVNAVYKFNKVIEASDTYNPHAHYTRGLAYGYMGKLEEGKKDFHFIISNFGSAPPSWGWAAYTDLSWLYFKEGDYDAVLRLSGMGLSFFPDSPWLLNMHGVALLNLGEKDAAAETLRRALSRAAELTEDDWLRAYPGNDPRNASRGLTEFTETIEKNIALAVDNLR